MPLPTPVFWPAEIHGQYSPWGRKQSDMTERLPPSLWCTTESKRQQQLSPWGDTTL